jgi:hypothetical protein
VRNAPRVPVANIPAAAVVAVTAVADVVATKS